LPVSQFADAPEVLVRGVDGKAGFRKPAKHDHRVAPAAAQRLGPCQQVHQVRIIRPAGLHRTPRQVVESLVRAARSSFQRQLAALLPIAAIWCLRLSRDREGASAEERKHEARTRFGRTWVPHRHEALSNEIPARRGPHKRITMRSTLALALLVSCLAAIVSAQSPASSFPRGNSQQAWQNPGLPAVLEKCKVKPPAFAIKASVGEKDNAEPSYPATHLPNPQQSH
jgi:hypothetical protein